MNVNFSSTITNLQTSTTLANNSNKKDISFLDNAPNVLDFLGNNEMSKEEIAKLKIIDKSLVPMLEKHNAFENLSKEEETLFKFILEDDVISKDELKNLSFEQMIKFHNILQSVSKLEGGLPMVRGFEVLSYANMTENEDLNKAIFDTLKNISDTRERTVFALELGGKLGSDNKNLINQTNQRVDTSNKNYSAFINNLQNEYKSAISNPIVNSEHRLILQKHLQYVNNLQENYTKTQKETKYA